MTRDEINEVFNWLHNNVKVEGLTYKMGISGDIHAYFENETSFATFYTYQILEVIKSEKEKETAEHYEEKYNAFVSRLNNACSFDRM